MNGRRAKIIRRQVLATLPSRHVKFDPAVIARRYRAAKKAYKKARDVLKEEKARSQEIEREAPRPKREPRKEDLERSPRGR